MAIDWISALSAVILGFFGAVILIVISKALSKAQAVTDAYNLLGGAILGFLLYFATVLPPPTDNISAFAYLLAGMGGLTGLEAFVAKYYPAPPSSKPGAAAPAAGPPE